MIITQHVPHPSMQIKDSACQRYKGSEQVSRMCELIPSIDLQLRTSCEQVVQSMGLVALLSLALMMMGTWYQWELAHVEKKAIKHKRRWDAVSLLGDAAEVGLGWLGCVYVCKAQASSLAVGPSQPPAANLMSMRRPLIKCSIIMHQAHEAWPVHDTCLLVATAGTSAARTPSHGTS